jgi:phosphoglycolate phosphatase
MCCNCFGEKMAAKRKEKGLKKLLPAPGGRYSSVLFDLDGTLTDSKAGITKSVQYALNRHGIGIDNPDDLQAYIGPPLEWSFQEYHRLSQAQAKQALAFYREYYERTGMLENREYPGIAALLEALSARHTRLFVVTSKPHVYARKILSHFSLDRFFESIEGSELDGARSDKAELIQHVLRKHALEKGRTVMIGDRLHDIVGAAKNGVDSVGVGYGFGSREELINAGATYYVGTMEELFGLFLAE